MRRAAQSLLQRSQSAAPGELFPIVSASCRVDGPIGSCSINCLPHCTASAVVASSGVLHAVVRQPLAQSSATAASCDASRPLESSTAAGAIPRSSSHAARCLSSTPLDGASRLEFTRSGTSQADLRTDGSLPSSISQAAAGASGGGKQPSGGKQLEFTRSGESRADLGNSGDDPGQRSRAEWEQDSRQREARRRLLNASLKHVKSRGWTLAAIQEAAKDLDLSPAIAASLERGPAELVEYFVQQSNDAFSAMVEQRKGEFENLRLRERVALLVRWRLELTAPYIDSWPQAMAIQAMPANAGTATRQLALLVDDMWHAAGDAATDYNWYTKRALLAGVYTATELYMLTDYSPGLADTWGALDRRIKDIMRLGRLAGEMGRAVQQGTDGVRAMASWVQARMQADPRSTQQAQGSAHY